MAISAPEQPGWRRWPQQQQQQHHHHHHNNSEYVVVNPSMMHYGSPPVTSGPLARPMMATVFIQGPYRPSSLASMAEPQFSHQMQFNSYSFDLASPASPAPPFKQPYPDRPVPRLDPLGSSQSRESSYSHDTRSHSIDGSRSPSIKSEATSLASTHNELVATAAPAKSEAGISRAVVPIITIGSAAETTFHTPIDNLMREIQAKRKATSSTEAARSASPATFGPNAPNTPQMMNTQVSRRHGRKVFQCAVPGCRRVCKQKSHLQTHVRSHTGEKPYICGFVQCGKRFSQAGNLKTHHRRHTKERPFKCDQCDSRFPQRGNLKSHMETHRRTISFLCKLDDCNKVFTLRGNLKTHQNHFHKQTIQDFHDKLQNVQIENITKQDLEMLQYLEDIHKNSNKGIKGRGRDCKVVSAADGHQNDTLPQASQPQYAVPRSMARQSPYMGHTSFTGPVGPRPRDPYDMYDMKPEPVASASPMPPSPAMYGDPDRPLSFGDRIF